MDDQSLLASALLAFDAAALQRIEEVASSPPEDPGSGGETVSNAISTGSGFAFALRSLSAITPYASEGVVTELIRWHDRERVRSSGLHSSEEERAVRECAVNCVFCERFLLRSACSDVGRRSCSTRFRSARSSSS